MQINRYGPVQGVNKNGAISYFQKTNEDFVKQYSKKNKYQSTVVPDYVMEESFSTSWENFKINMKNFSIELPKKGTMKESFNNSKENLKKNLSWEKIKATTEESFSNSKENLKKNLSWEKIKATTEESFNNSKNNFMNNMQNLYDEDIFVISNFIAGAFNLKIDEEDSGISTNVGAFVGGAIEGGVETVTGLYSTITDIDGTIEGINQFLSNFDENTKAIYNMLKDFWKNSTTEEKFREAGKLLASIPSGGSTGAIKGVSIANKTEDISKTIDKLSDISKMTDKANDMLPKNRNGGVNIVIEEVNPVKRKKIASNNLRKEHIEKEIKNFDVKKANSKQKGNYGELLIEKEMYEMGDLENINKNQLKSLDDPIHKGIDLILKNNTPPPEIVIVETKFRSRGKKPTMTENNNDIQMDDDWIKGSLEGVVSYEEAMRIEKLLKEDIDNFILNGETDKDNILKLATLIKPDGTVKYFKVGRDGKLGKELSKADIEKILSN